jgi:acetylornithine deacetylase/succinyl-diaminopimelate desuccinylase-like protein
VAAGGAGGEGLPLAGLAFPAVVALIGSRTHRGAFAIAVIAGLVRCEPPDRRMGTSWRYPMNDRNLASRVDALMPDVTADLRALEALPSVAFPGFPSDPVLQAAHATVDLLRRYGVASARLLDIAGGYPSVYGELPGPPGSPTVLLYAHYDVQPAPPAQGWQTDPFTPVLKDGRLYARGAADDKSGILQHAASIRALDGKLPVGIKILIEGEEETTSHVEAFAASNPDVVR